MKYKLLQIQLTDAEVDQVNATGHNSVPKQKARLGMDFADDIGVNAGKAFDAKYYDHVSNIVADDLNGVFHIGNMGPEENIERLGRMSSVSVGDIIEDEDGVRNVVDIAGFAEVV
jgi:hypothetical protein